jgi:hypothetical protein
MNRTCCGSVSDKKHVSRVVDSSRANDDFSKDLNSFREILDGVGISDQRLSANVSKALKDTDTREMREKRSSIFKVFIFRLKHLESTTDELSSWAGSASCHQTALKARGGHAEFSQQYCYAREYLQARPEHFDVKDATAQPCAGHINSRP